VFEELHRLKVRDSRLKAPRNPRPVQAAALNLASARPGGRLRDRANLSREARDVEDQAFRAKRML